MRAPWPPMECPEMLWRGEQQAHKRTCIAHTHKCLSGSARGSCCHTSCTHGPMDYKNRGLPQATGRARPVAPRSEVVRLTWRGHCATGCHVALVLRGTAAMWQTRMWHGQGGGPHLGLRHGELGLHKGGQLLSDVVVPGFACMHAHTPHNDHSQSQPVTNAIPVLHGGHTGV